MIKEQVLIILVVLLTSFKLLTMEQTTHNALLNDSNLFRPAVSSKHEHTNRSSSLVSGQKKDNYNNETTNIWERALRGRYMRFNDNNRFAVQQTINNPGPGPQNVLRNCRDDCSRARDPRIPVNRRHEEDAVSVTEDPYVSRLKSFMNYPAEVRTHTTGSPYLMNCGEYGNESCWTARSNDFGKRQDVIVYRNGPRRPTYGRKYRKNQKQIRQLMRTKHHPPYEETNNDPRTTNYDTDYSVSDEQVQDYRATHNGYDDDDDENKHNQNHGYNDEDDGTHDNYAGEIRHYEPEHQVEYWEEDQHHQHGPPVVHDEQHYEPEVHHADEWSHDKNRYEDKKAIAKLQEMYYCSKYCHCCKKGPTIVKKTHSSFAPLGKLLNAMKYFGFDSGYKFFYGRSMESGRAVDESKGVYDYVKNYFNSRYASDPDDRYVDDEAFFFFNKDKEEPAGVSECKEVCSCCEHVKREKLKKKIREMKIKEAKKKEKLKGITGVIRHLIFSDDDGRYDFIDDDPDTVFKGRSLTDSSRERGDDDDDDENKKRDRIGYIPRGYMKKIHQEPASYDPDLIHPPQYHDEPVDGHGYEHQHHVEDHHPKYIVFDCSKCCQHCKVPEDPKPRRRRRKRKKKLGGKGLGLLDFLQSLLAGDSGDDSDYDNNDDQTKDGLQTLSLSYSGGNDYFYTYYDPSITYPSFPSNSSCCFNSSTANTLIVVVTIALIILQGFSSVNIIIVVIVPLIFFGFIIIFIFLLLQALIPIYFIPIFIIVLIIALIPILLLVILFFLLLPLFLAPIFFPFILRLPGAAVNTNVGTLSCVGANCTTGSALNETANSLMYLDDSTETGLEVTTSIEYDSLNQTSEANRHEKLLETPDTLYWKLNAVLATEQCLERAGCHLATYTHSIERYNEFIFRILEKLSLSIDESKFSAYKEAYQIGSLNVTNHEQCATLYYCKEIEKYIKK